MIKNEELINILKALEFEWYGYGIVPTAEAVSQKLEIARRKGTIFAFYTLQMNGELRYAIARKTTEVHFLSKIMKSLLKI